MLFGLEWRELIGELEGSDITSSASPPFTAGQRMHIEAKYVIAVSMHVHMYVYAYMYVVGFTFLLLCRINLKLS